MARLGLSSPWIIYYHQLKAFFKKDSEIKIVYNEEENEVSLFVDNSTKANALAQILPIAKTFGNVTLKINIIPSNKNNTTTKHIANPTHNTSIYEDAFNGNPALSYVVTVDGIFQNEITYVVFVNEVVQYFNDSLTDIHGCCSTLYEDIARRIFDISEQYHVYFCTDTPKASCMYSDICASSSKPF